MAPSRVANVKLYYDISSTYSLIALTTLFRYQKAWNLSIELQPIFTGSVIQITGNPPPLQAKLHVPHLLQDVHTLSDRWGVDIRSPPGHPFEVSSLNVMRFLRVVRDEESQEVLYQCTRLLYLEFFSVQSPYNTPAFFDCLTPYPFTRTRLAQIIQRSQSPKNKAGLISDAKETVAQFGIFGVPLIAATRPSDGITQAWFGQDKIESIGWWLGPEYKWNGPHPDGQDSSIPITRARYLRVEARL